MDRSNGVIQGIAHAPIKKHAMTNHGVLNEAYTYVKPSSFSRGIRIELNGLTILMISGTASIDEHGNSVHIGDFRAQLQRTLANISGLLESEDCTWHDIVRTTCYLRDIDRDYEAFNEERTAFFNAQGLDPLPASTGIEAKLCRPELLVEIEAIAMFLTAKAAGGSEIEPRAGGHRRGKTEECQGDDLLNGGKEEGNNQQQICGNRVDSTSAKPLNP